MKEFSFHDHYGKSKLYKEALKTADVNKLTKLIGICSMLLQTKVYLFWNSGNIEFVLSKGELSKIDLRIEELFEDMVWLTILKYDGNLS